MKYNFSEERKLKYYDSLRTDNAHTVYKSDWTPLQAFLKRGKVNIVHDDFLTFKPHKQYDLIVMNPPFKDGDKHLLHALDLQRDGGAVVCLLNAETIRNPFTNMRKELIKKLDKYNAIIEYVESAFENAERNARVDVAIVKVNIPAVEETSKIFERLDKAAEEEEYIADVTDITVNDYIETMVRQFNIECKAGVELIKEYKAMQPRIMSSLTAGKYDKPILQLKLDEDDLSINAYLHKVILKYSRWLFQNDKFMGKLTSTLRDQYYKSVEKMEDYDFSVFNIKEIATEMNAQIMAGVQSEIVKMFERLTVEHSYYPECKNNIHYFSGWKTNLAHKIGKKSILPSYLLPSYSWSKECIDVYRAVDVLSDIEKIFDYLSGNMSDKPLKVDLKDIIQLASNRGQLRNIECTYFTVDIFKKGTVHIKYKYPELIDRFNIYVARNKNWLPPNYGKVKYADMGAEEKAVVNDFHKSEDESVVNEKKIEQRYNKIVEQSGFYLADPINNIPMLESKGE